MSVYSFILNSLNNVNIQLCIYITLICNFVYFILNVSEIGEVIRNKIYPRIGVLSSLLQCLFCVTFWTSFLFVCFSFLFSESGLSLFTPVISASLSIFIMPVFKVLLGGQK